MSAYSHYNSDVSEDHPAGRWRRRLLWTRSYQIAMTTLSLALSVYMLVATMALASELNGKLAAGATDAHRRAISRAIGGSVADILITLLSISLSITWLVFTVSPVLRARSCGGNRAACVRHSCDMGWDIVWAILWGVSVILNAIAVSRFDDSTVVWIGLMASAGNFGAFVSTAVVSGRIRNEMRAAAAARDIEAAAYSADGSTAAQAPAKGLDVAPATVVWPAKV